MTILWRIQDSNTYILGSVHATNIDQINLPRHIELAFSISSRVVFEADLDGIPDQSKFVLANGNLDDLLPPTLYQATIGHWKRLGLPEDRLEKIIPGIVAMTLQFAEAGRNGYNPSLGVDRYLWERTAIEGKYRGVLELFGDQLQILVESPLDEQISLLDYVTSSDDLRASELAAMVDAWVCGDTDHFERLLERKFSMWPKTFETLISQRNKNWIPALLTMARSNEPTLVVVGLLHLFGSTGIPALLSKNGMSLRPVTL